MDEEEIKAFQLPSLHLDKITEDDVTLGYDASGVADSATFQISLSIPQETVDSCAAAFENLRAIRANVQCFSTPSISSLVRESRLRGSLFSESESNSLIPDIQWSRSEVDNEFDSLRSRALEEIRMRAEQQRQELAMSYGNVSMSFPGGELANAEVIREAMRQRVQTFNKAKPVSQVDDDDFKIVQIHSREEAIKHGQHTGWCTANPNSRDYAFRYQHGKLYVLYRLKDGKAKRRPSYQLFVHRYGGPIEFQKKGCVSINPWAFAEGLSNETLKAELLSLLPKQPSKELLGELDLCVGLMRGRRVGRTQSQVLQWTGPDPTSISSISEEDRLSKKSFKARTPFDQLAQSRMDKAI